MTQKQVTSYKVNPDLSITIIYGEKEIPVTKNTLIDFYKRLYPGLTNYSKFTFSNFWNSSTIAERITFLAEFMKELIYGY